LLPKEKALEPKTVRIVKRESTERRKDRTYSTSKKDNLSHLLEDDLESDSGEPTSEPELDSEPSPAHIPSVMSNNGSTLKSAQNNQLSSSYSSGYSSASQNYLQQSSTSNSFYQTSSTTSTNIIQPIATTSNTSIATSNANNTSTATSSAGNIPSYSDRTASLPRNYGRGTGMTAAGQEWGEKPNRRGANKNNVTVNNTSSRPSNLPIRQKQQWKTKVSLIDILLFLFCVECHMQYVSM